jgi:hypothetical protein
VTPRTQPDPQSAALQMAVQPNLASLDELLAAIRALQFQADQEIARLLEDNAELLAAIKNLNRGECYCEMGVGNPLVTRHSQRCLDAQAAIANAERKPTTRTEADVEDDLRAIGEESGL